MPKIVLRNSTLPGQPVVVDVPVGGFIPPNFDPEKWQIDSATSAEDATAEAEATHQAAVDEAVKASAAFVPQFPRADNDIPAPVAPVPSTFPVPPAEDASADLDTTKES